MSLTRWVRRAGARRRSVLPCLLFALVVATAGPASVPMPVFPTGEHSQTHARQLAQTHARKS